MTTGEKISTLRQKKEISQKQLANIVGVDTATVALWESNELQLTREDIDKINVVLGANLTDEADAFRNETKETNVEKPTKKLNNRFVIGAAILVLVIAVILFVFVFSKFSKSTSSIAKAEKSVVKVVCYDCFGNEAATGSGFVAFDDKTIITNYHVVSEACTAKIVTDEDVVIEADKILSYSEVYDIAILSLKEGSSLKPLKLDSVKTKKGQTVTAIGSPLGIKNTVSQGVISGYVAEGDIDAIQFTASISHGSSGGALFNEKGNVIGITYASFDAGQNLNLAIPISYAEKLYENRDEYSIETAYMEKHPYAKYAKSFKHTTSVTIEELQEDPLSYEGQNIALEAFCSSVYEEPISDFRKEFLEKYGFDYEETTTNYYLSLYDKVSNDGEVDKALCRDYACIRFAYSSLSGIESCYCEKEILPGEKYFVLGQLNSGEEGLILSAWVIYKLS